MAWSDAARTAALMARKLRRTRMMGAPIDQLAPGQKRRIKQDRERLFGRLRNESGYDRARRIMGPSNLARMAAGSMMTYGTGRRRK